MNRTAKEKVVSEFKDIFSNSEIVIAVIKHEDWLARGVKNVIGLKRPVPYEIDLQSTDWFINFVDF